MEDELLICNCQVAGLSLQNKRWSYFNVDEIHPVEFNSQAFKSLVIPKETKEMLFSLVKVHATGGFRVDDIIKGKGNGLIFLLHGPPGVGKTLTAGNVYYSVLYSMQDTYTKIESIADGTKRPLYTISSGDLGTDTIQVEARLSRALALATSWNAVVLIDEADVFLEQRRNHDLKRNGLISGLYHYNG